MIEEKEKLIHISNKCSCQFEQLSSSYEGQIWIENRSDKIIFYSIFSTFAHFLKTQNSPGILKPHSEVQIVIKIKPTNQISSSEEKLWVAWGSSKINKFAVGECAEISTISLSFLGDFLDDKEINQILELDSRELYQKGEKKYFQGDYKQAQNIYEESFLLYRKSVQSLLGIANCKFLLKQIKMGIFYIDIYLLSNPQNISALILKASLLEEMGKEQTEQNRFILIFNAIKVLKRVVSKEKIKKGEKIRSEKILQRLQKIREDLCVVQNQTNFRNLLSKAIDKFDEKEDIKHLFKSKEEFHQFLLQMMENEDKNVQQTPQYALDPINYQIFRDPVIVPTGTTYERDFLMKFFGIHGHKDPYTRDYLNPNKIVHNLTLKSLVRNNPSLHKWLKYENQVGKF